MREPSLHITEKNLAKVLANLGRQHNIRTMVSSQLAKLILRDSKRISCNNRVVVVTSDRLEKKTSKVLKSSKQDANMVASLIYMIRVKRKHRGLTKIDQNNRDWAKVKELAQVCISFCNDFGLEKKEGFIKYLELGLDKISSYRNHIHKLVDMGESISNEYEAIQNIRDDEHADETREIHDLYVGMISQRTGITEEYINKPLKYVNFMKVRELTDKIDIPSDIFIKAQFESLAWASAFPDPPQLVGDKAMERLNKYLFENKMRKGKGGKEKKSSNLKNGLLKLKNLK